MAKAKIVFHLGERDGANGELLPNCTLKLKKNDTVLDPKQDGSREVFEVAQAENTLCPACVAVVNAYGKGFENGTHYAINHIMTEMSKRYPGNVAKGLSEVCH